jgi:hypothetical protein
LAGKPEGKIPLWRPRCRWEDNIKMDLPEVGCVGMDWIELVQDRDRWRALVNAAMNLWVLLNAENFLTSCKSISFSRRNLLLGVWSIGCLTLNSKTMGLTRILPFHVIIYTVHFVKLFV